MILPFCIETFDCDVRFFDILSQLCCMFLGRVCVFVLSVVFATFLITLKKYLRGQNRGRKGLFLLTS